MRVERDDGHAATVPPRVSQRGPDYFLMPAMHAVEYADRHGTRLGT